MSFHPVFDRLIRKIEHRVILGGDERQALASLEFTLKKSRPGRYLVREGLQPRECVLILEGFAFRQKTTQEGGRQIVSLHVPGELVDLEASLLKVADHSVQTLSECKIAAIPVDKLIALIDAHPKIGRALWIDTLIDASIHREWVLNLGRRSAQQRLAHLFCELAKKLELAGLGNEGGYVLPMTQEQLADAAGLTPVHINRSLKALEASGLILRERRHLRIPDFGRLRDASGFSELYLHLDQAI